MDNIGSIIDKSNHLSFLQARDSSILTGNIQLRRDNVKTALNFESIQEEDPEECGDNIKIYLRIKNADNIKKLYEVNRNEIYCYLPGASANSKNMKDVETVIKTYQFSHIFQTNSTQEEVFNHAVKPKLLKFINGENFTLMSYGASGSGKTYTMVGSATEPGIIPRTLEYLFRTLPVLSEMPLIKPIQSGQIQSLSEISGQQEVYLRRDLLKLASASISEHINTYEQMQHRLSTEPAGIPEDVTDVILAVWVSFAEIYNEHIYDLLTSKCNLKGSARPKLQLSALNGNTYIKSLTNVSVSSGIEAYQILQYGLHNLNYASTSINSHSSRSHCIFTIKIAQMVRGTNLSRLNYFHFCDLAGSERLKKTLHVGDRLKESNNINTSLLVLGRCISCVRDSQKKNVNKLIPFRESKLTRLFQRALSGHETISMIVNISPAYDMFEESQHVLNFSAIAKNITVKLVPLTPKRKNRFSVYLASKAINHDNSTKVPLDRADQSEIHKLQDIIDKLYNELEGINRYVIEQEENIREEMTEQYTVIIRGVKEHHQKEMKREKAKHLEDLQLLKTKYQNEIHNDEIITLSDDDDNYNQEKSTHSDIAEYKLQILALTNELARKDKIIDDLRETIEDARVVCTEIQTMYEEKLNNLIIENLALAENNSELRMEIQEYSKVIETDNYKKVKVKHLNYGLYAEASFVNVVEFHPSSSVPLVAGSTGIATLFAVDGKQNGKIHSVAFQKYPIFSAKFINNGNDLVLGSRHNYIYNYDLMSTTSTKIPLSHNLTQCKYFIVSPDQKYLAVIGRVGEVHILSSFTKERIALLRQDNNTTSLCFNPSGSLLYGHSTTGEITVWDMNMRRAKHKWIDDGCLRGTGITISDSNQFLATSSAEDVVNLYNVGDTLLSRTPKPKKTLLNLTTSTLQV